MSAVRWTMLHSDRLVDSRWVKVGRNEVALPNRTVIGNYYTVTISEAFASAALTKEQSILRQRGSLRLISALFITVFLT